MPILGPTKIYAQTDSTTAEMIKYMENIWGAFKVSMFNEFYEICKLFKIDYNEARELLLLDDRIERMHTAVFEDSRGWGGKCYPKDVSAIYFHAKKWGYDSWLIKELIRTNKRHRNETN